jgi:hypothetical protein
VRTGAACPGLVEKKPSEPTKRRFPTKSVYPGDILASPGRPILDCVRSVLVYIGGTLRRCVWRCGRVLVGFFGVALSGVWVWFPNMRRGGEKGINSAECLRVCGIERRTTAIAA